MDKLHQVFEEAFAQELETIEAASDQGGLERDRLIGLALSGGGIRSATFNLGILEGLKQLKLLDKIHYLSTVSGGGYIGAWLSANCQRRGRAWLTSADWGESIKHLRRYSNYLSPKVGLLSADTWSMAMVWLRNTLLVQLTLVLAIAAVLMVPRLLFPLFMAWPGNEPRRWLTIVLIVFGIAGVAGNLLRVTRNKSDSLVRDSKRWPTATLWAADCLLAAWCLKLYRGLSPFHGEYATWTRTLEFASMAFLLVVGGFLLLPAGARVLGWSTLALRRFKPAGEGAPPNPFHEVNYNQAWVQLAIVVPLMLASLLVASVLWNYVQFHTEMTDSAGLLRAHGLNTFGLLLTGAWRVWPFPLMVVFASLGLLAFSSVKKLTLSGLVLAPVISIAALHGLMCAVALLLENKVASMGPSRDWWAFVWGPPAVAFVFSLSVVVLIGIVGLESTEGAREWWSRVGAWLGIYGLGWMVICVASVYGPNLAREVFYHYHYSLAWLATTAGGLLTGRSAATGNRESDKTVTSIAKEVVARVAPVVFIAGLLIFVSTAIHEIAALNAGDLGAKAKYWFEIDAANSARVGGVPINWILTAACCALLGLFAWRVDINEFSLNAFYRSRLVRCYLGATIDPGERNPQRFTNFDDHDDLEMAKLAKGADGRLAGPLHIVNCALNLGGSSDLALHTRHSASFALTPLTCGSAYESRLSRKAPVKELGFLPTSAYGGSDCQPTLGQAISVSGAAASPNSGYHTSSLVAFLMTVFNVRLGWWFPNPIRGMALRPTPRFSLRYLLVELFGLADDHARFLAISDGGHFENLGAYELVRRKCRVIIIGDAECDPLLEFEGLGTLIRMCEVDFGVKIEIDTGSIAKGDSGWSGARCAVGTIDYGDAKKPGILIYLKAAVTGQEDASILQYKSAHPTFPHETTANQFYGEDQFESYRMLGHEIAMAAFEPALEGAADRSDLVALAETMKYVWSPALPHIGHFTQNSAKLMELWEHLGNTGELKHLDVQLVGGEWPRPGDSKFRQGFYLASRMLQLMENVYLELNFEQNWDHTDNQGWRELFKTWAKADVVKGAWELAGNTYGLRFRYFCKRNLKLPLPQKPEAPQPPRAKAAGR